MGQSKRHLNGKAHFLYLAQSQPPRQHYVRRTAPSVMREGPALYGVRRQIPEPSPKNGVLDMESRRGFRLKAQGCAERATLGNCVHRHNPNGGCDQTICLGLKGATPSGLELFWSVNPG